MRVKQFVKKSRNYAAAGLLCISMAAGLVYAAGAWVKADEPEISYNFTAPALSGEESSLLLQNPDRGLRMEVYLDVATGKSIFEYADQDAIDVLEDQIALYASDQPQLVQVYFYLTGYKDKPLDQTAFDNMNRYFEQLEKHNLKAVFRFAYISDDTNPTAQEPSTDQIVSHMEQLKDFIEEHKDQIHVFQMGLIGAWGEWDSGARSRMEEKKVVQAVLENTPVDMYLQVRYLNIKNKNVDKTDIVNWNRVGYHDDFLIGRLHDWNTAGADTESEEWKQMTSESANLLVDGEMIWGSANDYWLGGKSVDSMLIAKRMKEHHFTSLSLTHNYKESNKGANNGYSMVDWQHEYINRKVLEENNLPYEPSWFKGTDGSNISRTMFDYIRDYLGYYLTAKETRATVAGDKTKVSIALENYGFAAPLALQKIDLVLLDSDGREVERESACQPAELQPGAEVQIQKTLTKPDKNRIYRLALSIQAEDGTPVRLANDMEYQNGYLVLGDL